MITNFSTTSERRIDFVVRSDAFRKPGGDTHQVERYSQALQQLGYDVRTLEFRAKMEFRDGSIVHIVNVDRPYDFIAAVNMAFGHKIVVSTIHHDLECVRLMRRAECGQGIRSLVGRVFPESGRELVAFAVRQLGEVSSWRSGLTWLLRVVVALAQSPKVWKIAGRALDRVHAVTLLAQGESVALVRDTGWSGRNGVIIPNGVPRNAMLQTEDVSSDWTSRPVHICVVGRIEPRKRSLEVARAISASGLKCVFVGPTSASAARYGKAFAEFVGSAPTIDWLGAEPHSKVQEVMRNAKVLVNASWVEVQSLVDIEAASSGCWVVTGRGGNSREWLGERLVEVDSHDLDEIMEAVTARLDAGVPPTGPVYDYTWEEAAQSLSLQYEAGAAEHLDIKR